MKQEFNTVYYPEDISKVLCNLVWYNPEREIVEKCAEAIYQLKAIAENPYNNDCYRTFYKLLEKIVNTHEVK